MHCNFFRRERHKPYQGESKLCRRAHGPRRDGEAPKDSAISVGQLRSRFSSCLHLPMLFQLAPQAVSDLLREAQATDEDTVSRIEIFTDGSSLSSRGLGFVWRPRAVGEFSSRRGVTLPIWRSKMSKSDPTASVPLEYWTGVTVALHTCGWCERLTRVNGKMSVRIPWPRWSATPSQLKIRLLCRWGSCTKLFMCRHREFLWWTQIRSVYPFGCRLPVCRTPRKLVEGGRFGRRKRVKRLQRSIRKACRWKAVAANVLTFQPVVDAAGFFDSGRRLEFEKRIADLKVDFAGMQEGWQRSSATRQVGTLWCQLLRTEATVALKLGYIVRTFPNRNTSSPCCQTRGDWWFVFQRCIVNWI